VAIFVINEWLWADASGQNGQPSQRQAYEVIAKLGVSDHSIVIIERSPFDQKAWNICKSTDTIVQAIARAYVVSLRQNFDRCLILKPEQLAAMPDDLAAAINPDDRYLVEAQLTVAGAVLVTTDERLCEAVRAAGLSCLSREEFLSTQL